jgi:PAS domain S-box-containing protein
MKQWKAFKSIISNYQVQTDLFLTLIDEGGNIICTNANMQKSLHLKNPREVNTNIFQLIHPDHVEDFKNALEDSRNHCVATDTELYLKNGYYHPMKWQVSFLETAGKEKSRFLCVGHKLVDENRAKQFNLLGEKNYQLIVEGLNAGILFQDLNGEIISANKKAAEILDTSLENLYQLKDIRSQWDSWQVHYESGERIPFEETPFMRSLATSSSRSEVMVIKLASGEERFILFSSQPLSETDLDTPNAVVTNIVDVTIERNLHTQIQESDIIFRAFMNKTPNLAWVLDENANLLFGSTSFYKYFGLKEEQSIGKTIFELIPGSVAEALSAKHWQVIESGRSIETVEKVNWSDGTQFIFHVNIFPIDTMTGRKMVGGHAVNLADKYAVEKQLREVNERLLLLSRATTDAIWEWDMQTGHIFRNESLMNMIGYQGEEAKGLSWWLRRIHPEDRNRVTDKIKEATDNGQHSWEDKYRFKCFDGEYKHIQDKGYVVYENGLPVKMIGSLQDITELKHLEDQLTAEKLQRQKEISETVIRVQEKERTKIGHELHDNVNQILSTTKMFVEMLKPVSDEDIRIREKSIEYLLTAIEEIRKLSKELVVPQLKDKGLVESIYNLLEDIEISGKLKVSFVHDHENDLLSPGKKVTIFRIVQEQFKNILKYSQAKHADVCLTCKNDHVQLMIRDDGIGFDTKRSYKGIGLSNIHDRARFYNGSVDIQSAPGKGCQLTVIIPFVN